MGHVRGHRGGTGQIAACVSRGRPFVVGLVAYSVAVRARSRTPAVVPIYMSRVVRTLACPAMAETSVASSFQVNRAVVHSTCRRLCQVHWPLPPGSKLEDRHQVPRGEGNISPSGLVPAFCSARAAWMRAAIFAASG